MVNPMVKVEKLIITLLKKSEEGLTLSEIAEKIEQTEKKTYRALKKLFEKGEINSNKRRYSLANN
jgi:DNA-binding IclR family transcriptional regulator